METNNQVNCYTNYKGINNLNEIGLVQQELSVWQNNPNGFYFYFLRFRNAPDGAFEPTVLGGAPIPTWLIDLARHSEQFYIVLDDTEEGYAYYSFSEVYEFVNKYNLHKKIIYATGHLESQKVYDYWLKKKKVPSIFYVWSLNLWYHRMRDWVNDCEIPVKYKKNIWYCCMNNRPRLHRHFTIAYLDVVDILEDGIVTANDRSYEFDSNDNFENSILSRLPEIPTEYQNIIKQKVSITNKKLPLVVDTDDLANKSLPNDLHPKIYDNTLINLVTETYYFPEYNFIDETFITEKTWKVFTAGQIPVIIGARGLVQRLRLLGFDMFDDIVDHSYDTADDSVRIFKAIESMHKVMSTNNIQKLNLITQKRRILNRKKFLFGLKNLDIPLREVLCT